MIQFKLIVLSFSIVWGGTQGNTYQGYLEKLSLTTKTFKLIQSGETACSEILSQSIVEEIAGQQKIVNKIIQSIGKHGKFRHQVWNELATFVDRFGSRMSGTKNLEDSIDYIINISSNKGFDKVYTENATIPNWQRGKESCRMVSPRDHAISMLGLGHSVGTPEEGITAKAIVVDSFEDLELRSTCVQGKIVVFNQQFEDYFKSVKYRIRGASLAAKYGAVAALVRSITPFSMNSPHTGTTQYDEDQPKIPVAAITIEDAQMMHRMQKRGENITLHLYMEAHTDGEVISRNIIMDTYGSTLPNETVIISGHIDSWDIGQGAMDDAGGSFISLMAGHLLNKLNLRPKRTVRVVLWTGEELGLWGARQYYKDHPELNTTLSVALESDSGTFKPLGLTFAGSHNASCVVAEVLKLLKPIGASKLQKHPSPVPDLSLWANDGVPVAGLHNQNDEYFWFHHTGADSLELENPGDLDEGMVVFAAAAYVLADLTDMLPR